MFTFTLVLSQHETIPKGQLPINNFILKKDLNDKIQLNLKN